MGCGFLESVYQECLEIELHSREIPFVAQQELLLHDKSKPLKTKLISDFVCYGKIVVELKAVTDIAAEHKAQVINYLKATGMKLGDDPQRRWLLRINTKLTHTASLSLVFCDTRFPLRNSLAMGSKSLRVNHDKLQLMGAATFLARKQDRLLTCTPSSVPLPLPL